MRILAFNLQIGKRASFNVLFLIASILGSRTREAHEIRLALSSVLQVILLPTTSRTVERAKWRFGSVKVAILVVLSSREMKVISFLWRHPKHSQIPGDRLKDLAL